MSSIYHEAFVPYHFGTEWLRYEQGDENDLLPVTPANPILLPNTEREQSHRKTTRFTYEAVNFQHLSWIARLFSPAFVNHSDVGDTSGTAAIIEALPYLIFTLPDLQISLQFLPAGRENIRLHDRYTRSNLHPFTNILPGSIEITWTETRIWCLDADGKIVERWQAPVPVTPLRRLSGVPLNPS